MEDVLTSLLVDEIWLCGIVDSFIWVEMNDEKIVSGTVDDDGKLLVGIFVSRGNFVDNSSSQNDLFMRATSNKIKKNNFFLCIKVYIFIFNFFYHLFLKTLF